MTAAAARSAAAESLSAFAQFSKSNSSNLRLLQDTFLPLARSFAKSKLAQKKWVQRRCDIVSESLCDDTLKYLAPTLDQYKNKNTIIIDINPGSCLWSKKLNDYLRPSRHVLLEPDELYHEPFVKPLLDQPGSSFRHSTIVGVSTQQYWSNWSRILGDTALIPSRPALPVDSPALRRVDTTFLVTGNLWRSDLLTALGQNDVDPALLILSHMGDAALSNSIFQGSGLVRMLFWMPNDLTRNVMPTKLSKRGAYEAAAPFALDYFQVAGFPLPVQQISKVRDYYEDYPHVSYARIKKRTQDLLASQGIDRPTIPTDLTSYDSRKFTGPNPLEALCPDIASLRQLISDTREDLFSKLHMATGLRAPKPWKTSAEATVLANEQRTLREREAAFKKLAYPQLRPMLLQSTIGQRLDNSESRVAKVIVVTDCHLQCLHLEVELAALAAKYPDQPELEDLKKLILDLDTELDAEIVTQLGKSFEAFADQALECVLASYMPESPINRDNRPTDSLIVEETEFWPPRHMALVMLTPRLYDLGVPGIIERGQATSIWRVFLKTLFSTKSQSLAVSLNKLAPNAAEDLIPLVPGLADPRTGGRLSAKKIKPKMLVSDVLGDLFKQFCEWPFKPTDIEIMLAGTRMSSASETDDETVSDITEERED